MSDLHEPLQRYLTSVLGESVGLRPVEEMRLPLYLEAAYELWRGTLFGSSVVLAVERHEGRAATPGKLARELATLREAAGSDRVALVLTNLPSRERRRLVQHGVPFIVPGRQLHLPMFLVDLREHFPRPRSERPSSLAWASQLLLIRHLLRGDVEGRSLSELASLIGYAAMTLTNVRDELTRAELCAIATRGRSKHLRFPEDRRETWERALPLLRSPVRKAHEMDRCPPGTGLVAGPSALARATLIADDPIPTFALHWRELKDRLGGGGSVATFSATEPACIMQSWMYDPGRVAEEVVDPLSLYLSLRDSADERIQIALDELLEKVSW